MIRGSCLCGNVRYEIHGMPRLMYYCHCVMCRKATGTSFATNIFVHAGDLAITAGRDSLKGYRSSPDEIRHFCGNCGSPVYSEAGRRKGIVSVRCGLLNDDPLLRPSQHIYTAFKAPWYEIHDAIPQFPGAPDDKGRPEQ